MTATDSTPRLEASLCLVGDAAAGVTTRVEALRLLAADPPDVTLLDINLDGARTTPVALALAADGVPFIAVTEKAASHLVNEHYAVLQRALSAHERLERIVLSERGLDGVAEALASLIGDQQAATMGHLRLAAGEVKITYGTAAMLDLNVGPEPHFSTHGAYPLVLWQRDGVRTYCLEGTAITAGAAVSNPTTSSIPASSGSAMLNPFDTRPTTTSLAAMPVRSRYRRSACTG